jgi:hypothetical protein
VTKYCSLCYRSVMDTPCDATHCPGDQKPAPQGNKASSVSTGADLSAADSVPVARTPPILTSRGLLNNPAAAGVDFLMAAAFLKWLAEHYPEEVMRFAEEYAAMKQGRGPQ